MNKFFTFFMGFGIIFITLTKPLDAQPFSEIELMASYGTLYQYEDNYNDRLAISDGLSIALRTPYYIGYLGFNLDYFSYKSKSEKIYDYTSLNSSLGLFKKIKLLNLVSINMGLSVGIQNLLYDKEPGERAVESELFYSLQVEPSLDLKRFSIVLDTNVSRVYSYHRQTILFIGVGLKTSFRLSKRIQQIIF